MTAAETARKRRPRRVASDEAHAWARSLPLDNPNGKTVLRALALYVNGEGCCFVGIDQLSDDTDLSVDTVRRRLVWLEQVGAIVRLPQWLDNNGVRNGEGRGKRTTDEIRLLLDADLDEIEARARGEELPDAVSDADEISPSTRQGLNHDAETALEAGSPTPALRQPSQSCEGLTSEPEPLISPQPPSGGSVDIEGWKEFQEDWSEPILRQSMAQQVWQALTADERSAARQAARGYVAWRKSQRKPPNVLGAHLFLKERDAWAGFAKHDPKAHAVAPPGGYPRDSVEGLAIKALYHLVRSSPMETGNRIRHLGELTPQVLALADSGEFSSWPWIEDRQQIAAWRHFVDAFLPRRGEMIRTRGIGADQRRGIYAPWPWPPRKDGTLSSTGPPETLMTEQDLQDFK